MYKHVLTDAGLAQFDKDWAKYNLMDMKIDTQGMSMPLDPNDPDYQKKIGIQDTTT